MSDDTTQDQQDAAEASSTTTSDEHEPPEGVSTTIPWTGPDGTVDVAVEAGWTVLRRDEKPSAEVFSVAYTLDDGGDGSRPVTFVFNGGPGAASAYLHVGVVGPRRVAFPDDGSLPGMPPRLVDNPDAWLAFTDLVFVDPVGTGYSRTIDSSSGGGKDGAGGDGGGGGGGGGQGKDDSYYAITADLDAVGETITRWLSANGRWGAPVFIAGESYGGYRVARMARRLQEHHGVGLSGAILISPAIELAPLEHTDYDVQSWVDRLPTMAAAAQHHGRAPALSDTEVVAFATGPYAQMLLRGDAMDDDERAEVLARYAEVVGLSGEVVDRHDARVPYDAFARELLRDERRRIGLYDGRLDVVDPFPGREPYEGPDPTLAGITPAFTTAANQLLSSVIGVRSERRYELLAMDVFSSWKVDPDHHAMRLPPGGTDDLRYGLAFNTSMRVYVCHGRHDLVTPWYATQRLLAQMRLTPDQRARVTSEVHEGGHMFYTVTESREAFTSSIASFVADSLP